jgi:hypothetical protein
MACVVSEPLSAQEILWHPVHKGALKVVNEFTGESKNYTEAQVRAGLPIASDAADGHLYSAVPN